MAVNKPRRLVLMLVILLGPFSLLYFLSQAKHGFVTLPYVADRVNEKEFVLPDFQMQTANGTKSISEFEGKKIISITFQGNCPWSCSVAAKMFRFMIYDKVLMNEDFKNVVVISEILDSAISPLDMTQRMEIDPDRWIFYKTDSDALRSIQIKGKRLDEMKEPKSGMDYYPKAVLLFDNNHSLRGMYDGAQSVELKILEDELRLLMKEMK